MTLDELKAKMGEQSAALAAQYGPTVLNMAKEDVQRWIDYVFVGRYIDAYTLCLKAASNDELLAEWDLEGAKWKADNLKNAEKIEMSSKIAQAICNAMLTVVLAVAGF